MTDQNDTIQRLRAQARRIVQDHDEELLSAKAAYHADWRVVRDERDDWEWLAREAWRWAEYARGEIAALSSAVDAAIEDADYYRARLEAWEPVVGAAVAWRPNAFDEHCDCLQCKLSAAIDALPAEHRPEQDEEPDPHVTCGTCRYWRQQQHGMGCVLVAAGRRSDVEPVGCPDWKEWVPPAQDAEQAKRCGTCGHGVARIECKFGAPRGVRCLPSDGCQDWTAKGGV